MWSKKPLCTTSAFPTNEMGMDVSGCVPDVTFRNTGPLKIQRGNNGPLTNGL